MKIILAWHEVLIAATIGSARTIDTVRQGWQAKTVGLNKWGRWGMDIEGACAEMAFAKFCGIYWSGGIGTFKSPDVGKIQVRGTELANGSLIVRPHDPDNEAYLLVTGAVPAYEIVGYLMGKEAKRPEWLRENKYNDEKHGPAYFVPQPFLIPASGLKDRVRWQ